MKKILCCIIVAVSAIICVSCSKDNSLSASDELKTSFTFSNQTGKDSIVIDADSNWSINGVYKLKDDNTTEGAIFGTIYYYRDGQYQYSSQGPLSLNGLGKLETNANSLGANAGFMIERTATNRLVITVDPNYDYSSLNFGIVVSGGDWEKIITVRQDSADHFTMEKLQYVVSDDVKSDSIYWAEGNLKTIDVEASTESTTSVTLYPFDDSNAYATSCFASEDSGAFYWAENNSLKVEVPHGISNGQLYYVEGETAPYSSLKYTSSDYMDFNPKTAYAANLSSGKHYYRFILEMRQIRVEYNMKVKNERTGKEKTIKGIWTGTRPTGTYRFKEIQIGL